MCYDKCQEEFVEEGIVWKNIEFSDNTDCVQLFDKKSIGLFDLLEKESRWTHTTVDLINLIFIYILF